MKELIEQSKLLVDYLDSTILINDSEHHFLQNMPYDWNLLMQVYDKIAKNNIDSKDEDLDILMIIVGDNLLDSDREGFFLSLVEVVKYLKLKNNV